MKRLIFAGLVTALISGSAFAQNNSGYVDDVYYNGSQAEQDAKADAKRQKKQKAQAANDETRYNSSGNYYADGNQYDGNAEPYGSYYNQDDSYIDYDDDSYTTRMRRFYYPMTGVGYWGGIYSPYWYDPFFTNPYYGWGGWYNPGFTFGMSWGFGGGPYWNNCWGMNTWFGYGGFSSWYYPGWGMGMGMGWGYGAGYWNGYYAGMYDAGRYNNYRNAVNYGPRGNRNGIRSTGIYGTNGRAQSINRGNIQPANGRQGINVNPRNSAGVRQNGTMQTLPGRGNNGNANTNRSNVIRLSENGNDRVLDVNPNAAGRVQQQPTETRRGLFNINRGNNNSNVERSAPVQRQTAPSRNFEQNSRPAQNFNSAPSRNFSSPAPSRSNFGGGGGGGRSFSGGRR